MALCTVPFQSSDLPKQGLRRASTPWREVQVPAELLVRIFVVTPASPKGCVGPTGVGLWFIWIAGQGGLMRRAVAKILLMGLTFGGGFIAMSTAQASNATQSDCRARALEPRPHGTGQVGYGGAYGGCTDAVTWRSQLKRDISFLPDKVIVDRSGYGDNYQPLYARCTGGDVYYVWTGTNIGSNKESAHVNAC